MSDEREAFLAGERPDDVVLFLSDAVVDDERLAAFGERVDGGHLLVVDGERGRNVFRTATGVGAMEFASAAMGTEGVVDGDLSGGTCPDAPEGEGESEGGDHAVRFLLGFAEERNEEVGGIYAEGPVVHAYAQCACGTRYSDRWVAPDAA